MKIHCLINQFCSERVKNDTLLSEEDLRARKPSQVWVSVRNEKGEHYQVWLETIDSYLFTAEAAVLSVEKVLAEKRVGILTPAQAFGTGCVLEVPGTKRMDKL